MLSSLYLEKLAVWQLIKSLLFQGCYFINFGLQIKAAGFCFAGFYSFWKLSKNKRHKRNIPIYLIIFHYIHIYIYIYIQLKIMNYVINYHSLPNHSVLFRLYAVFHCIFYAGGFFVVFFLQLITFSTCLELYMSMVLAPVFQYCRVLWKTIRNALSFDYIMFCYRK